jgi:hypothetical protein
MYAQIRRTHNVHQQFIRITEKQRTIITMY